MQGTEGAPFRPTLWPGHRVAEPLLDSVDTVELTEDGWLLPQYGWYAATRLPAEAYLHELADADPRSRADLKALIGLGCWGPLGSTVAPHDAYRDLPASNPTAWRRALAETAALNGRTMDIVDLEQEREMVMRRHHGWPAHVEEVAIRLRAVQALTRHLVAFQEGRPVEAAWRKCASPEDAWERFAQWANAALRDFHVRVLVNDAAPSTVYAVAILQLVNDLSEGETFRRCANETCGRPFVRQRGRARYADKGTRHSTGVLYCTRLCARAQAERMRRRAKRDERNGS